MNEGLKEETFLPLTKLEEIGSKLESRAKTK